MRARRILRLAVAIAVIAVVGGCSGKPLVSDIEHSDQTTLWEQRAWAAQQADEAIEVLGQEAGWDMTLNQELLWAEDRGEILRVARIDNCRPSKGMDQPSRSMLRLANPSLEDPFEAAVRLKQHWVDQGWDVTYVLEPEQTPEPREYFRADREDGAMLLFDVSENIAFLDAFSSCSERVSAYDN